MSAIQILTKGNIFFGTGEYLKMRPNRCATDSQLTQFVDLKLLLWVF